MQRRIILWGTCVLLTLATAASSFAADLFGPREYVLAAGKPQSYSDAIAIAAGDTCGDRARYFLVVESPGAGVSSATVAFNGSVVLQQSDFPLAGTRELPVTPAAANTLAVTLNGGKPGAALRITLQRRIQETIAGPETVTIQRGTASASSTFTVADAGSVHLLRVQNGGAAHAAVTLNGAQVIGGSGLPSALVRRIAVNAGTNTITIAATGQPGATLTWSVERELPDSACGGGVAIDLVTPSNGATVTARRIAVSGTVAGPRDVGVTVNGFAADVDLTAAGSADDPFRWFALVDAESGNVHLTATATTGSGAHASDSVDVAYAPSSSGLLLRASPASGAVPLTVHFDLSIPVGTAVTSYELDLDANGTWETAFATPPDALDFTYTTPGLRTVRVRAHTAAGVLEGTTYVAPQPFEVADAVLRAVWTRFTEELALGNIEGALAHVAGGSREKYRRAFTLIGPRLPEFAAGLEEIHAKTIGGQSAHYLLRRIEEGRPFGYHIHFVRSADGVWRIAQF